jgi:hypothetical protein
MSNVVLFPKTKRDSTPVQSIEELIEKTNDVRRDHVEYLVDEMMSSIFQRCYDEGFDLTKDQCVKSNCLFVESFRSVLYSASGLDHPLQTVADEFFVEQSDD